MVRPQLRSTKIKKVRTPGGILKIHRVRDKTAYPKCAETGKKLHGVVRGHPSQVRKVAKSKRRPNRPYGGNLSAAALRRRIKAVVRTL